MRRYQIVGKVIAQAQLMLLRGHPFSYASTSWNIDLFKTLKAILRVLVICLVKYVLLDDEVVCTILSRKSYLENEGC